MMKTHALIRTVVPSLALVALLLAGCGGKSKDENADVTAPPAPVEDLYNNGVDALNAQRYSSANDQFNLVEQNYPYSTWAVKAQLMQGYTQYLQNNYTDAIGTLDRYIQLHPAGNDVAYAYYLRALCYYEQIADIQRDQRGTQIAMNALQEVVNRFPDSAYARDARLKIDLCNDHLAGKEMEVGRWYQGQHLYEAAIGRFQRVVDDWPRRGRVRGRAVRAAAAGRDRGRRGDRRRRGQAAAPQDRQQAGRTGRGHHPGRRRRPDRRLPALGGRQSRTRRDPRHQESRRRGRRPPRQGPQGRDRRRAAEDGRKRRLTSAGGRICGQRDAG